MMSMCRKLYKVSKWICWISFSFHCRHLAFSIRVQRTDFTKLKEAPGYIARSFFETAIRSLSPGQRNTGTILHPSSIPLMNWSPVLNRMIMSGLYLIIHKWNQNQVWTDISSLCHVKLSSIPLNLTILR